MTTLDERAPDVRSYDDLLVLAVKLVIETQFCTPPMLRRKLRANEDETTSLLVDLEELGVTGPPGRDSDTLPVLLPVDHLQGVLDTIASRHQSEPEEALEETAGEVVMEALDDDQEEAANLAGESPDGQPVSLVKPGATVDESDGDEPGGDEEIATVHPLSSAAGWVRWHAVELVAVIAPSVAGVMVHPGWWLATGGVAARWAALEWRAHRRRGGQR